VQTLFSFGEVADMTPQEYVVQCDDLCRYFDISLV
jgi:hypothetical protein